MNKRLRALCLPGQCHPASKYKSAFPRSLFLSSFLLSSETALVSPASPILPHTSLGCTSQAHLHITSALTHLVGTSLLSSSTSGALDSHDESSPILAHTPLTHLHTHDSLHPPHGPLTSSHPHHGTSLTCSHISSPPSPSSHLPHLLTWLLPSPVRRYCC
ncbi:hypothetical protein EJ03DRAFT_196536 [Teratosphaeria nubilosa]|uniref:Uncharacterized protein n=1 Tax=Teratosphaeria nubilosa TaxID=161662 RepID=A0A6G1KYX0_9PEZI|nr:hypothetical protein EJ03DRAFT_196536 [Teratosphaeria nubilosa]